MLAAWDVHAMPRYGAAYLELAPRGALPLAGLAAETGGAAPELGITMLRRQTMIGGRSNRRVVIVSMASAVEIRIALDAVSIATS